MVSIVIADDLKLVLHHVRETLETEPDFSVTASVTKFEEVIKQVSILQPDVLLMDTILAGNDTVAYMDLIRKIAPGTRIIFYSLDDREQRVALALQKGASGYILKNMPLTELHRAITTTMGGTHYLCTPIYQQMLRWYIENGIPDQNVEYDPYLDTGLLINAATAENREEDSLPVLNPGDSCNRSADVTPASIYYSLWHRN